MEGALQMRVGILTWYIGYNIGASLQAFALQKKINVLFPDTECEVVCYQTKTQQKMYSLWRLIKSLRSKNPCIFLKNLGFLPTIVKKKKDIDMFIKESIVESGDIYSEEDIEKANSKYDVFICGSDQIWNPNWLDKHYLLDFVEKEKYRIAYAPSIGVDYIPDEKKAVYTNELTKFNAISVREKKGAEIIRDIMDNKDITSVCDPSLLLNKEQWNNYLHIKRYKNNYIFVYLLGSDEKNKRLSLDYAKRTNRPVHYLKYANGYNSFDSRIRAESGLVPYNSISPGKFVEEITNASLVITDSFHGVCFSIIEHTRFLVLQRAENGKNSHKLDMYNRIKEVVEKVGLEQCCVESSQDLLEPSIDWSVVDSRMKDEYIFKSENWLKESLEQCVNKNY